MQVTTDFPGGNAEILAVEDDLIRFRPDQRDSADEWFYWAFEVSEATQGALLTLTVEQDCCFTKAGVAASVDGGVTWNWLPTQRPDRRTAVVTLPADRCRLSMSMPYQLSAWEAFCTRHGFAVEELTADRSGRSVPMLVLGDGPQSVLLTARHHCCEMMPSYVMEGIIEAAQADPAGLRWIFIPFVDLDGVEAGDQGKGRKPHDHNRDYLGDSRYPTIAALREQAPHWNVVASLDMHGPWIEGEWNESIYVVGCADQEVAKEQRLFVAALAAQDCPLPFSTADYLPHGEGWNNASNYGGFRSCSRWAIEELKPRLGGTLEISYGVVHNAMITQDSARAIGGAMYRALVARGY